MLCCKSLNDLCTTPMAVHVAETADVHQDVKPKGSPGVKRAKKFVVLAAVANPQLDDLRNARAWKAGHQVTNLAVRVVAGGVDKRRRKFHFKALGAFNQVHQWRRGDGYPRKQFGGSLC